MVITEKLAGGFLVPVNDGDVKKYLIEFRLNLNDNTLFPMTGSKTRSEVFDINGHRINRFTNEFWTSRQRQSSSIHEISYRACFKAQLPRFFIELLTEPGDIVFDPFSGRGTTVIEAAMLGRKVIANDINPLSRVLSYPRLAVPDENDIFLRLNNINYCNNKTAEIDLSMFYHPETEAELQSLKEYLASRKASGTEDDIDKWIRMVATNRLTGHSSGFFSVYTLPPNQAVSQKRQLKINKKREQSPEYRNTKFLIMRKSKQLLKRVSETEKANLRQAANSAIYLEDDAGRISSIEDCSVNLTVTSPPFLDVVQYSKDNWLRCWFNNIDMEKIEKNLTMLKSVEDWSEVMGRVFKELFRITKPKGWVAFEVGEVHKGRLNLEEYIIPIGIKAGFNCLGVVINEQIFTKTSNIWGVNNNSSGTNTNRITLFQKT
jgi:DNA modification methylase